MRITRTNIALLVPSILLILLGIAIAQAEPTAELRGHVIDASTRRPIEGAWVVSGQDATRTNSEGMFVLAGKGNRVGARAIGYSRQQVAARPDLWIALNRLAGKRTLSVVLGHWLGSAPDWRSRYRKESASERSCD